MSDDKPRDPQMPPQNDALKTRIDKLGDDIDRLDEEALAAPARTGGRGRCGGDLGATPAERFGVCPQIPAYHSYPRSSQ